MDEVVGQGSKVDPADLVVQEVDGAADPLIALVELLGPVAAGAQGIHLVGEHAEDEDVVVADGLVDLDVGAILGAEGDGAVHHQLHVAGAGRLGAGQRDLLADVGGGHHPFGQRDAVVLDVDHSQFLPDAGIGLDEFGQLADELDDLLGDEVARGGLGAEEVGLGREGGVGVLPQGEIIVDDVQGVEVLALVLVQALDLHVEDAVGVDLGPADAGDVVGQADLVVPLDGGELLQESGVVGKGGQLLQLGGVLDEAGADLLGDEGGQLGVGLTEPAAVGDAVGDVGELLGHDAVEVVEDRLLEDVAVQAGDAVDLVPGGHAEVGHAHDPLLDDGDAVAEAGVARLGQDLAAEPAVDLLDDLVDAGQAVAEHILAPALERLLHDGVVGVGDGAVDDAPRVVPGEAALVHHDAHQFGHAEGGVGVVDMDGDAIGQTVERAIDLQMAADDVLNGGGHEEVLLAQAEGFALGVVVGGIEHLADDLGHGVLLDGAQVLALIEQAHVEAGGARRPEAEDADGLAVLAGDHHVARGGLDRGGVAVLDVVEAVVPPLVDVTVKVDGQRQLGPLLEPDLAAGEPEVGHLHLPAVDQLLTEDAKLVLDGIAHGGVFAGGQPVENAGGETAEAAVAQARVGLQFIKGVEIGAQFLERAAEGALKVEIVQGVAQGTAQQELHAQVADLLALLIDRPLLKIGADAAHDVGQHLRAGLIKQFVGGGLRRMGKG